MSTLYILLPIIFYILFQIYKNEKYKSGSYYQITKNPYSSVKYDKGKYGEYLIYESLHHFENDNCKFLFNALIPKKDGGTTEIDMLIICSKCIIVFECKNYSGWIFGNEAHRNWTQTLPQGRGNCHKEYFYNPIMQNASHIRHLRNILGKNTPMQSLIVFSNRCTLKDITINSRNVRVMNRYHVASVVSEILNEIHPEIYTDAEINEIYNKLLPYAQLDSTTKNQRIESTKKAYYSE